MGEEYGDLEKLYSQVEKNKDNYASYLRLLHLIVEKQKKEWELIKQRGVLLTKDK